MKKILTNIFLAAKSTKSDKVAAKSTKSDKNRQKKYWFLPIFIGNGAPAEHSGYSVRGHSAE